jgi:hypothetical protein
VIKETVAASAREIETAESKLAGLQKEGGAIAAIREWDLVVAAKRAKHEALLAVLQAEALEEAGKKGAAEWEIAAKEVTQKQRASAFADAVLAVHQLANAQSAKQPQVASGQDPDKARKAFEAETKKLSDAIRALAKAEAASRSEASSAFTPRSSKTYPATSTGRRLAFAKWLVNEDNPLAARVAANHLWLRHFGRGLVATPENFGSEGARPSHPALLDWLAAELMKGSWRMKALHRLIVTSNTYRMASTPDAGSASADPDNVYLWRMPTRRMEAELVRDNLLYVAGSLDLTMGGPEIDHQQGLASRRRSLYLRSAAEKEVEFLKIFDGPSVTECYQRRSTVMPQQSLALANSELTIAQAGVLAKRLSETSGGDDDTFIRAAFSRVLARPATAAEVSECARFLQQGRPVTSAAAQQTGVGAVATVVGLHLGEDAAVRNLGAGDATQKTATPNPRLRERLIQILFNHHDFVTIR